MARMWIETFREHPDADFVYSGYEFVNNAAPPFPGEPFDPYLLKCGNYIATMFPMKRSVFPGFDESLKAGQDWDMWLTIVEKGGKGRFIEGFGFITEPSGEDSISGKGWAPNTFDETVRIIKEKHGIPTRDIVVGSAMHKGKGLEIAKLLDADFVQFPSWRPHRYKCVINLGFGDDIRFRNAPRDCLCVQYWMPWDIDGLEGIPYRSAIVTVRNALKEVDVHLCNEIVSQKRLRNLGIEQGKGIPATVLPLPTDIKEACTDLPKEFRVLMDVHEVYKPVFKDIKATLPYIQMDDISESQYIAPIDQYSLLLSFYPHPTVDEAIKRALLNGRHVISNVQAPYCGYVDLEIGFGEFKDTMIQRLRDARYAKFNKDAQDYYAKVADPFAFKTAIQDIIQKHGVLEAVPA
jgi:hypothetical protein